MNKFYALLTAFVLLISSGMNAQVTLNNSPYEENFNSLNTSGIPTGFSVRTLATPTFLGKDTSLNSGVTPPWRAVGRGFKNFASANATTDPGIDSTTQAAITDRALGVRQTGTFGDSGAAFVFQIANTLAKKNFELNFNLQSLDTSSPRITNWIVDYGIGASPSSFTALTTNPALLSTGNKSFTNTNVSINFGSALDNINDIVWIRVLTVKRSTNTGNRASSAIDNWNLSWQQINTSVSNIIREKNYLSISGNLESKLNLVFNKTVASFVNLQILSLNGRVIYQKQLPKVVQGQNEDISGLNLSKGIYILKIESKDGIYSTKLVR